MALFSALVTLRVAQTPIEMQKNYDFLHNAIISLINQRSFNYCYFYDYNIRQFFHHRALWRRIN